MAYVALVLGIFLFYQFVPRKHKVLFLKVGSGLLVLAGLTVFIFSTYQDWKSDQKRKWASAEFVKLAPLKDGKMGLEIRICNKNKDRDLLKYEVSISGYNSGRSTSYKLYQEYGSNEGSNQFKGDIIIKPESCESVVWTGEFRTYDEYKVTMYSLMNEWGGE